MVVFYTILLREPLFPRGRLERKPVLVLHRDLQKIFHILVVQIIYTDRIRLPRDLPEEREFRIAIVLKISMALNVLRRNVRKARDIVVNEPVAKLHDAFGRCLNDREPTVVSSHLSDKFLQREATKHGLLRLVHPLFLPDAEVQRRRETGLPAGVLEKLRDEVARCRFSFCTSHADHRHSLRWQSIPPSSPERQEIVVRLGQPRHAIQEPCRLKRFQSFERTHDLVPEESVLSAALSRAPISVTFLSIRSSAAFASSRRYPRLIRVSRISASASIRAMVASPFLVLTLEFNSSTM